MIIIGILTKKTMSLEYQQTDFLFRLGTQSGFHLNLCHILSHSGYLHLIRDDVPPSSCIAFTFSTFSKNFFSKASTTHQHCYC